MSLIHIMSKVKFSPKLSECARQGRLRGEMPEEIGYLGIVQQHISEPMLVSIEAVVAEYDKRHIADAPAPSEEDDLEAAVALETGATTQSYTDHKVDIEQGAGSAGKPEWAQW